MANNPVRRGQLVVPFGVGAMMVVKDGTSIITAGLDNWYKRADVQRGQVEVDEFIIQEWRLQQLLGVGHLRLPPDFRKGFAGMAIPNPFLTVPGLRFPQWHFCPKCRRLEPMSLEQRGRIACQECRAGNTRGWMAQVPFVAMCARGHIQDFPWREWVHADLEPRCQRTLRLYATGSASLASQQIVCECGAKRNLQGVTTARPDGSTFLTSSMVPGKRYECKGSKPWLGSGSEEGCGAPVRGTLRGAGNVYFADVKSSIFLPRENPGVSQRLLNLLDEPVYSSVIRLLEDETKPRHLRARGPDPLQVFSDSEIVEALRVILRGREEAAGDVSEAGRGAQELELRGAEFVALSTQRTDDDLVVRVMSITAYGSPVREFLESVSLVDKLRETRAFVGFSRVFPEDGRTPRERSRMLWKVPPRGREAWLPAQLAFGEGIFLRFDEARLSEWERRVSVQERVQALSDRYTAARRERQLRERILSPRFVLLHTFSHVLMTRLIFECGYASASLRERIYVSAEPDKEFAGVLIYTAAGDSDGTMGGLVRMGRPSYLEPVMRRSLEGAQWCSADPVCIETRAQGPLSCNLAACHNCVLVPETACEEMNRFLDRALLVGTISNPSVGFFTVSR
jgi:MrfA Zn-binding domain